MEKSHQLLISETAEKFGSTDTMVLGRRDVGDISAFPPIANELAVLAKRREGPDRDIAGLTDSASPDVVTHPFAASKLTWAPQSAHCDDT